MKRIIAIAFASILLSSCSIFSGMTKEEQAARAVAVEKAIADMDFKIDVKTIYPNFGMPIHTANEYELVVKDGKVTSWLPFFGQSRNSAYGGTDSGIKFKDWPITPQVLRNNGKDGHTTIVFNAKSFNDVWHVTVDIWDNGTASVNCDTRDKSIMRYDGELVF